jgi:SAM-dependent methyltransferase
VCSKLVCPKGEEVPSPPSESPRSAARGWQQDFFRDIALDCWRAVIPQLPTLAEADFLGRVFKENQADHVLDLACGSGRHALELARRGLRVTGVDLSAESIAEAQTAGAANARFVCADMLDLSRATLPDAPYDGAYCFGNSIGFFDRSDLRKFLTGLAAVLRPGARFVVDTGMIAESILASMPKGRWFRFGDLFMLSEHRYQPRDGRLDIDYTFIRGDTIVTRPTASFVFTLAEFCRLFADAGFATVDTLATLEGAPFGVGSPRLLLVTQLL